MWCLEEGRVRSGVSRCTCHLREEGEALVHLEEFWLWWFVCYRWCLGGVDFVLGRY